MSRCLRPGRRSYQTKLIGELADCLTRMFDVHLPCEPDDFEIELSIGVQLNTGTEPEPLQIGGFEGEAPDRVAVDEAIGSRLLEMVKSAGPDGMPLDVLMVSNRGAVQPSGYGHSQLTPHRTRAICRSPLSPDTCTPCSVIVFISSAMTRLALSMSTSSIQRGTCRAQPQTWMTRLCFAGRGSGLTSMAALSSLPGCVVLPRCTV